MINWWFKLPSNFYTFVTCKELDYIQIQRNNIIQYHHRAYDDNRYIMFITLLYYYGGSKIVLPYNYSPKLIKFTLSVF